MPVCMMSGYRRVQETALKKTAFRGLTHGQPLTTGHKPAEIAMKAHTALVYILWITCPNVWASVISEGLSMSFRMAGRFGKSGRVKAFGAVYSSLQNLLHNLAVANFKRRRHELKEATHFVEYKGKTKIATEVLPVN